MIEQIFNVLLKILEFLLFIPIVLVWSFVLFLAGDGRPTTCRMR